MPSKNTPEQPDRPDGDDPVAAEAPTQQLSSAAEAPVPQAPLETPAPRNRLAWVSSPRVAAATVITVFALGALGGAFALGRATAGHDHGPRGVMVEMGVPGGQGFDGRGFGRDRFGGMPMPGQQGWSFPQRDGQANPSTPTPSTPTPSEGAEG
jgi:hypothetical protein